MFDILVQASGTAAAEGEFDFRLVNLAILVVLIGIAVYSAKRHNRALRNIRGAPQRSR